jgi:hypothetical protein
LQNETFDLLGIERGKIADVEFALGTVANAIVAGYPVPIGGNGEAMRKRVVIA